MYNNEKLSAEENQAVNNIVEGAEGKKNATALNAEENSVVSNIVQGANDKLASGKVEN